MSDQARGMSSTSVSREFIEIKKQAFYQWPTLRPHGTRLQTERRKPLFACGCGRTIQHCSRCECFLNQLIWCHVAAGKKLKTRKQSVPKMLVLKVWGWYISVIQCSCLRHVRFRISCHFNSRSDLEQMIEDECRYERVREVKRMNKHNSVHLSAWIMHRQFRCGTLWKSNASEAWKL